MASSQTRTYREYGDKSLQEALDRLRAGELTQRGAEKKYNIPLSTLKNKLNGLHPGPVGRPKVFTDLEETILADRIHLMCDWGFQMSKDDLKNLVKNYLDSSGRVVDIFKDNYPGYDWIMSFMARSRLTLHRKAAKRKGARITQDTVHNYFDRLCHHELEEGVPPEQSHQSDISTIGANVDLAVINLLKDMCGSSEDVDAVAQDTMAKRRRLVAKSKKFMAVVNENANDATVLVNVVDDVKVDVPALSISPQKCHDSSAERRSSRCHKLPKRFLD